MSHVVFPSWLHDLAAWSLTLAFICAAVIVVDELGRPQKMWIMNLVWPLTALFGSVLWLTAYFVWGRDKPRAEQALMKQEAQKKAGDGKDGEMDAKPPFPVMVGKGASHCGAGCTLGDIIAEWFAFGVPAIAVALGWKTLFSEKLFAVWILDYMVAFGIGVMFQYFTIKPMRDLSVKEGIVAALKADFFSITAWQVGMYGFMAFAQLVWFTSAFGGQAEVNTPEFWFVMQIAMICGFVTSYPVNWILIKVGLKEKM
jgi:hypothetical protein